MNEFEELRQITYRMELNQDTFGGVSAWIDYSFEKDNGTVPQLEQARRYVANWNRMRQENLGLLFWGRPGNGKTFAAGCIANALINLDDPFPPKVRMTTLGMVLSRLPAMSPQEKEFYLRDLQQCDLLILDDFGMERQTEYGREQVFGILDGRYLARMPLIVTTNLSLNELKHPADLPSQRIYDRVLEMCVPVCFDGDSLRPQKAREKLRLFKEITGA